MYLAHTILHAPGAVQAQSTYTYNLSFLAVNVKLYVDVL